MSLKGHGREIALTAVLLILAVWFLSPSLLPQAPSSDLGEESPEADPATIVLDGPDVDLALLTQQPGEYRGGGRNLFDYGRIAPPPPTQEELDRLAAEAEARRLAEAERRRLADEERERLRQEALERQKLLEENRSRTPPPPPTPPKPVPPAFPYKFIGVLGESAAKIAIFLDDKDFLMAQEGETLKEDFRIVKIGYDTLQIGYTNPLFEEESEILKMGKN